MTLLVFFAAAVLCLHLYASSASSKERTSDKSALNQRSYPLTQKTNGIAGKLLIAASGDKNKW